MGTFIDMTVSKILKDVSPEAALEIAEIFGKIAHELQRRADIEKRNKLEAVAKLQHTRRIDVLVNWCIHQEMTLQETIEHVRPFDVWPDQATFLYKSMLPAYNRQKRAARADAAVRMFNAGYSYEKIAEKLECSRATVARYIKARGFYKKRGKKPKMSF